MPFSFTTNINDRPNAAHPYSFQSRVYKNSITCCLLYCRPPICRRKAAGKAAAAAAAARQWKVGDLVLAKVKGFPAWPATVSEPKKWGYSADLKKVMVYFFGTQQIAFCNPADVQAFTEEKKHTLSTKRHGKGSDFVRAMKEIIESYEKIKNQVQTNDQKSPNDAAHESGGSSAESLQVRENQPVASLDTQFDSDICKGEEKYSLFSEDASAAEQMLALSGNNTSLEQLGDSLTLKETPKIATYSTRRRRELRSEKFSQLKKAPLLQQSKSSSKVDVHRFQSSMLVDGSGLDDMNEGAVRSRKQIRRLSSTSESNDVGLLTLYSNGSGDEGASEIATVESDNSIPNGGTGVDSISKSENSTKALERLEGELELKKACDIQVKATVVKKKRKPTRKRGSSDAANPPAKLNVVTDMDTGVLATCHISQNSLEDLSNRLSKDNGDEHLPLVKRARVRMSRTYTDDEVNASSHVEERLSTDTVINELSQTMSSPIHDYKHLPICQSYEENNPKQICLEMSAKSSGDVADVLSVAEQRSLGNTSPSKVIGNQFCNSQQDEQIEPEPLAKQFNSKLDGESSLPRPEYSFVEAVSVPVEEVQVCSTALSTMNMLISEPDMAAVEGTHETNNAASFLQLCGVNSFAGDASEFCIALNSLASEEPAKPCAVDESQQPSPGDNMVNSANCLNEKSYHDDSCTVQTVFSFEARDRSPSILSSASMLEKVEADDFELRKRPGIPCKDLVTSNQISENPVQDESNVLFQHGEPQAAEKSKCMTGKPLKPEDGDYSQQNDTCKVIAIAKDQVQAANSVSVNDDHSCEKMSISPDLSGSPVRATPCSTSGCHISTAESVNTVQSNSGCSPKAHLHDRRSLSDALPEEGEGLENGVSQRPKFVGISSNYTEAQNSLQLFEGALGSLVRTKESIARATRLAMDCAKLGLSAKVMEIIANNLENESDLQMRVKFFFLVDSIAQCSRSLKGDSGGPYLLSIQSMLPRLLFATAPPGATTQENRTQCLKVLRLWLERRVLPEYVLCHHIKELDSHSSSLSACLYSRRSARTERALDDPVRDMEGMLVDEYGSNSTLQLPGFSMPSLLKDEDEGSDSDGGSFEAVTPEDNSETLEEQQEQLTAPATERHTRILEEVDGELEMEDVAPSCDIISTCNHFAQDGKLQTSQNQFGQEHTSFSGRLSQDGSSSSPPLPPPPPHPAQCAMSNSYSNGFDHQGYPDVHGDHLGSASRISPPMLANKMPYPGLEPTSSNCNSHSGPIMDLSHNEGSNFQPRHHPPCPPHPPPPPPSNQFPYMPPPRHHTKSRRDMHPYSHRSPRYMHDYDERHYNDHQGRMRPGPYDSRDNRRYPPHSYGPRYHEKPKGPYGQGSYGCPPRELPRFHNQRSNHPPRPFNHHRNSFHYKQHSEGPVSVGMRDPDMWHERW